jgi:hypothetical protein
VPHSSDSTIVDDVDIDGPSAARSQFGRRFGFSGTGLAHAGKHSVAGFGQPQRDRAAKTATRPGDESSLSVCDNGFTLRYLQASPAGYV